MCAISTICICARAQIIVHYTENSTFSLEMCVCVCVSAPEKRTNVANGALCLP